MFSGKYGVAKHIYINIPKAGSANHAVSADWTPAAGDVKISKNGGVAANVTNLPTAIAMGNSALWDFSLTNSEMEAAQINITVADSATKAVDDTGFVIETYGHASANWVVDLSNANLAANVTQWLGTNASTPTVAGVPNVNVKTWNDLTTVALPLVPTTAGRTLDVSAGGEAGVDWANVGSPTTTVGLTNTTVGLTAAQHQILLKEQYGVSGTVWCVSTTGNDTTGDGLTWATAYALPSKAASVAASGDLIVVGIGTFAQGETVINMPSGVSIRGHGETATIISTTSNTSTSTMLRPGSNAYVRDMSLSSTGTRSPCGSNTGQGVFTNAVIENVRMHNDSDSFVFNDAGSSVKTINCRMTGILDGFLCLANSTSEHYNLIVDMQGSSAPHGLYIYAGRHQFFGGSIMAGTAGMGLSSIAVSLNSGVGSPEVHLDGVKIVSAKTGGGAGSASDITIGAGTVTVTNCEYDTTKVTGTPTVIPTLATAWNSTWDAEVQSEVQDAIEVNHLDHLLAVDYDPASKPGVSTALLNELVENDLGVSRFSANTLEQAPSGGSAADNLILNSTTIATLASQTSFTLTAGSADNDAYNNRVIIFEDAATAVQKAVGVVSDYVGATKTVTINSAPAFTIATTDTVRILAMGDQYDEVLATVNPTRTIAVNPVAEDEDIEIVEGDDYSTSDTGRALQWSYTADDMTSGTLQMAYILTSSYDANTGSFTSIGTGTITYAAGVNTLKVALTAAETATLTATTPDGDSFGYTYRLRITKSTRIITPFIGAVTVKRGA